MGDLKVMRTLEIALRRFALVPLKGADLALLRDNVLDLSQSELGDAWRLSRSQICRIERQGCPEQKICDQYLGLMVRTLFQQAVDQEKASAQTQGSA